MQSGHCTSCVPSHAGQGAAGGDVRSRINSKSPRYETLSSVLAGASSSPCPHPPSRLVTVRSDFTDIWHASLKLFLPVCGGRFNLKASAVFHSLGSTTPSVTSTAHVPHDPMPRQQIKRDQSLCGVAPLRKRAVLKSSPRLTPSMVLEPSAETKRMDNSSSHDANRRHREPGCGTRWASHMVNMETSTRGSGGRSVRCDYGNTHPACDDPDSPRRTQVRPRGVVHSSA